MRQEPTSTTAYVGLNPGASKKEAGPLKKLLGERLSVSVDNPTLEKKLSSDQDLQRWVNAELPESSRTPARALMIVDLLKSFPTTTRDSLAAVIVTFDRAERGEIQLERIILSGHSNGVGLWGDPTKDNRLGGRFVLDKDLQRIAKTFPNAARQVEDVLFSACFSVVAFQHVRKAFPNVQTIAGYEAFSPKAGKGSMSHIKGWEKATRGKGKKLVRSTGRGSSSLWNADLTPDGKFVRNDPARIEPDVIINSLNEEETSVMDQLQGTSSLNRENLAMVYGIVQRGLANPRMEAVRLVRLGRLRDQLLRLRFWGRVTHEFASAHETVIKKGYTAAGLSVEKIDGISRKNLKAQLARLKAASSNPETDALVALLQKLWDLTDTTAIPETWIG